MEDRDIVKISGDKDADSLQHYDTDYEQIWILKWFWMNILQNRILMFQLNPIYLCMVPAITKFFWPFERTGSIQPKQTEELFISAWKSSLSKIVASVLGKNPRFKYYLRHRQKN